MAATRSPLQAVLVLFALGAAACAQAGSAPHPASVLEMSYPFDANTIYWPNARPFVLAKGPWGINEKGYWYASNEYSAAEHGGTHADAPIHFARGGRTIDQIPIQEWIGPAAKIDVTAECAKDRNYLLRVADVERWEASHGRLPSGAWVIMYTGIGTAHYPDKTKVLGTDLTGEAALVHLSFPGFSPEVATFLVKQRSIRGIAIDTPSIDCGRSTDFMVHQIVFAADRLALENIANLDKLPAAGAMLYVVPMLIAEGTGAPARVFAILP